ncbi:MAG: flagellar assembly peptidoglycan hydrolase FlgJ [Pseudomonadales bacterium]
MIGPDGVLPAPMAYAGQETYTDYGKLRAQIPGSDREAIARAARQFESVFLNLWLKSMRDANAAFGEGSFLDSQATQMHEQMLDGELSVSMANAGGIGLAEVIARQLSGEAPPLKRDEVRPAPLLASPRVAPAQTVADPADAAQPLDGAEATSRRGFLEKAGAAIREGIAGTPLPVLGVLAQAVLETGWGKSVIQAADGTDGHNLFGVKATGWSGASVKRPTTEYLGGRFLARDESFRVYTSPLEAVTDYVDVLRNSDRFKPLFGAGSAPGADMAPDALQAVRHFADTLQKGGYATDPHYADKIVAVARSILRLTGG